MKGLFTFTRTQKTGLLVFAALLFLVGSCLLLVNWSPQPKPLDRHAFALLDSTFDQPDLPVQTTLRLDINLADSADWTQLPGIGKVLAARIIKYRNSLGGFRSVDQLSKVFNLPPETLASIRGQLFVDSLTIPVKESRAHFAHSTKKGYTGPDIDLNLATAKELEQLPGIGGVLSQRIVNFREAKRGFSSIEELRNLYHLSPETFEEIAPHLTLSARNLSDYPQQSAHASPQERGQGVSRGAPAPSGSVESRYASPVRPPLGSVNINEADTTLLMSVPGIGSVLSQRIIRYRKLLGFFTDPSQLQLVYGLTKDHFDLLEPYITVGELSQYPKRDLNRAYSKSLAFYPFLDQALADALVSYRKELGRFDNWEEVAQVPGITPAALEGLQLYYHL
ncbi:MAG: helix-hairpin-helix domain-containing protein [Bacteroidia bacterium]|nr:helix-hairpin-helix domain-containing protein [Bacteroidia bacterium]